MSFDKKDNDECEGRYVHDHEDKDGKVEQEEQLISLATDEANLVSYFWMEIRIIWKNVFQQQKNHNQHHSRPPPNHKVEDESDMLGRVVVVLLSEEAFEKIATHYGHPREHRDGGKVAKVTKPFAEMVIFYVQIEDCEQKCCYK